MSRLDDSGYARCLRTLDRLWPQIEILEVDQPVVFRAAELTDALALRGYDAVHCAAAEQMDDSDLVAASGDRRLLTAWKSLGVATFDTNAPAD